MLLTGLYLAATEDAHKVGNKAAAGGFTLGVAGLGVGVLELALRSWILD